MQIMLFLGIVLFTNKITIIQNPFNSFCQNYPCGAVKFLKNNPQYHNLKIFNDYNYGGYLIWTCPNIKLFIDGRLPQYDFAGHTLMEEYYEFAKLRLGGVGI